MLFGRVSHFAKKVMGGKPVKFQAPAPTLQSRPKGKIKPPTFRKKGKPNTRPSSGIGVGP